MVETSSKDRDDISVNVSQDKRSLTIQATDSAQSVTVATTDLDSLIRQLAAHRAGMLPAVPFENPAPGTKALSGDNMRWFLTSNPKAETFAQLWTMHPGYGWFAQILPRTAIQNLSQTLEKILDRLPTIQ